MEKIKRTKKVIIIGAGMSGIKAAHTLSKAGVNVLVLESSSCYGGRMKNFQFCGETFEQGANWITGLGTEKRENPVWTLAKKVNLTG